MIKQCSSFWNQEKRNFLKQREERTFSNIRRLSREKERIENRKKDDSREEKKEMKVNWVHHSSLEQFSLLSLSLNIPMPLPIVVAMNK